MSVPPQKGKSQTISGAAGVYFVAGELSRLGHVALTTTRNTKGIDLVVSDVSFQRTVSLQVKTNSRKYDFWIVGKPKPIGENIFYVFVNLLDDKARPEYYIVPSKEVFERYQAMQNCKNYESLTDQDKEGVAGLIKAGKTAWGIVEELRIKVDAVRKIAKEYGYPIKYDRGKGEDFPFSFYIRKSEESKYKDQWNLLRLNVGHN